MVQRVPSAKQFADGPQTFWEPRTRAEAFKHEITWSGLIHWLWLCICRLFARSPTPGPGLGRTTMTYAGLRAEPHFTPNPEYGPLPRRKATLPASIMIVVPSVAALCSSLISPAMLTCVPPLKSSSRQWLAALRQPALLMSLIHLLQSTPIQSRLPLQRGRALIWNAWIRPAHPPPCDRPSHGNPSVPACPFQRKQQGI